MSYAAGRGFVLFRDNENADEFVDRRSVKGGGKQVESSVFVQEGAAFHLQENKKQGVQKNKQKRTNQFL